jgi:murein L,D-transpeptidase YcbB/YkuD
VFVCVTGATPSAAADPQSHPGTENLAGAAAPQMLATDIARAISAHLLAQSEPLAGTVPRSERSELEALYALGADAPVWVDSRGTLRASARRALTMLEGAASEGLDPADYGSAQLRALAAAVERAERVQPGEIARFDVAMSAGVLRFFRHLHQGRVDPRAAGFDLSGPAERLDLVMLLRSALAAERITDAARELTTPLVQYRLLRDVLTRYRSLAADSTLCRLPPFAGSVHAGDAYAGLQTLQHWLVALGDLPPDAPAPGPDAKYDDGIVEAVKRFQVRHGLEPDGVLGKSTHAALNVPLTWRVRQIELALERLRWLPALTDSRLIALNIPMFYLWAWDGRRPAGERSLGMRAIVGRALGRQTPVFAGEMRYVIFRPYWNVPSSILHEEILPVLGTDPHYLRRQNMEIVRGEADDAPVVDATAENLALLGQGTLRLRQRPGPHNSLGLVKFVFPNNANIFLHGTPAWALFDRARRDFSHGCVRVEDPVSLAAWVLDDQPQWTKEQILGAIEATASTRVDLTQPVRVILFYTTAMAMPDDGTIHFAEDIYAHDKMLDRVLTQSRSAP